MALIHIELDADIIPCGIIIRGSRANHQLMAANGGVEHELCTGQFGYADFRRDIFTATLLGENIFRADPKDHSFTLISSGLQCSKLVFRIAGRSVSVTK